MQVNCKASLLARPCLIVFVLFCRLQSVQCHAARQAFSTPTVVLLGPLPPSRFCGRFCGVFIALCLLQACPPQRLGFGLTTPSACSTGRKAFAVPAATVQAMVQPQSKTGMLHMPSNIAGKVLAVAARSSARRLCFLLCACSHKLSVC